MMKIMENAFRTIDNDGSGVFGGCGVGGAVV